MSDFRYTNYRVSIAKACQRLTEMIKCLLRVLAYVSGNFMKQTVRFQRFKDLFVPPGVCQLVAWEILRNESYYLRRSCHTFHISLDSHGYQTRHGKTRNPFSKNKFQKKKLRENLIPNTCKMVGISTNSIKGFSKPEI